MTIIITAVVTAAVTSLFWISAYNMAGTTAASAPSAAPAPVSAQQVRAERPSNVAIGPTGLAIPVAGISANQLADTYTQSRGGGHRVHNAIDIMAPRGTLVVASAPGVVEKLFFSNGGGGITAYVRSPDRRWMFYYAHLDAYAAGLREGQALRQGDPIGTVGFSGNANPAGPHLHFAIHRMAPSDSWHQGTPINPYPLLIGREALRN